jgi:hypothetical protein
MGWRVIIRLLITCSQRNRELEIGSPFWTTTTGMCRCGFAQRHEGAEIRGLAAQLRREPFPDRLPVSG